MQCKGKLHARCCHLTCHQYSALRKSPRSPRRKVSGNCRPQTTRDHGSHSLISSKPRLYMEKNIYLQKNRNANLQKYICMQIHEVDPWLKYWFDYSSSSKFLSATFLTFRRWWHTPLIPGHLTRKPYGYFRCPGNKTNAVVVWLVVFPQVNRVVCDLMLVCLRCVIWCYVSE